MSVTSRLNSSGSPPVKGKRSVNPLLRG
jgi:hypothetical protein